MNEVCPRGQVEPAVRRRCDTLRALAKCRDIAMAWTALGRIPECGKFGEIAQDLDAVCEELENSPQWHPITDAERTGEVFLCWFPHKFGDGSTGFSSDAFYMRGEWCDPASLTAWTMAPTHWLEITPPNTRINAPAVAGRVE